jgi:hypothetical protein
MHGTAQYSPIPGNHRKNGFYTNRGHSRFNGGHNPIVEPGKNPPCESPLLGMDVIDLFHCLVDPVSDYFPD